MTDTPIPLATDCNVRDDLKHLPISDVQKLQADTAFPYALAAINLNGDLNLGVMIRSAVIFGAERFFIFGKKRYDKRSTVGAHNYIDLVHVDTDIIMSSTLTPTIDKKVLFDTMDKYSYRPVFIEQDGHDIVNVANYWYANSDRCYIFGNEGYGLDPDMTAESTIISIPQYGVMRSLNVSAAASIICQYVSTAMYRSKKI